jgi:predicted transcriptional regulator
MLKETGIPNSSPRSGTMKRSRQEIISQILEICIDGASKTKIVYQANLNFKTINPYLDLLIKNGLIQVNEGPAIVYETTPKGIGLIESIKRVRDKLLDPI